MDRQARSTARPARPADTRVEARRDALDVITRLEHDIAAFERLPDLPGQRVQGLFAGIYRCSVQAILDMLRDHPDPAAFHLVIAEFYLLYREHVVDRLDADPADIAPWWRRYHRLARRLTMRSPISAHLVLLSLGARAHVRHDLGAAIRRADLAQRRSTGAGLLDARTRDLILDRATGAAFMEAFSGYIAGHRLRQHGWRRWVLGLYGAGLRGLGPVWLGVLQSWRRGAVRDAITGVPAGSGNLAVPAGLRATQR